MLTQFRQIILLVGAMLMCLTATAQDPFYRAPVKLPGMSDYFLTSMNTTSEGLMLLAHSQGVQEFDGTSIRQIGLNEGLPDAHIQWTTPDNKGRIWLHSSSGQLAYYFEGQVYALDAINKELESFPNYNQFFIGRNDTIICQYFTRRKQAAILPDGKGGWNTVELTDIDVKGLQVRNPHHPNQIIGHLHGYHPEDNDQILRIELIMGDEVQTLDLQWPSLTAGTSPWIDVYGDYFLVSFGKFFFVLDKEGWVAHHQFKKNVVMFKVDEAGKLWCFFEQGGTAALSDMTDENTRIDYYFEHEKYGPIESMCRDFEGGYWFFAADQQLMYVPDIHNTSYRTGEDLYDYHITACLSHGDTLFIGYGDGSVTAQLPDGSETLLYRGELKNVSNSAVFDMIMEGDTLWVAFGIRGLMKLHPETGYHRMVAPGWHQLFARQNNKLLVCHNEEGISEINGDTLIRLIDVKRHSFPDVTSFVTTGDSILMGTSNGLYVFHDDSLRLIRSHRQMANGNVVVQKPRKNTFAYLRGGSGVMVCIGRDTTEWSTANGLLSNHNYKVELDDEGNIWIAGSAGITKIMQGSDNTTPVMQHYTFDNVLGSVGLFWHRNQLMAFGKNGITTLDPVPQDTVDHRVDITALRINNKDTTIMPAYDLGYMQNNIVIHFKGASFKDKLAHEYRLLGADTNWIRTENTSVPFLGMAPADYTFEVRAINYDGSPGRKTARIQLNIHPPFWQTWWFQLSVIVIVMLIAWFIVQRRIRQIRKESQLKNELVKLENKALSAQMNPHFIFNALTSIQNFILKGKKFEAYDYLAQFAILIRSILKNSEDELVPLDEELKLLKLYLDLEQVRYSHSFEYEIIIPDDMDEQETLVPPMLLQPYAENSVRHGFLHKETQNGKLTIAFEEQGELLKCVIEDNGIGRKKAMELKSKGGTQHKSFAMSINKRRLNLLNKIRESDLDVHIEDLYEGEQALGTRVTLYIPLED